MFTNPLFAENADDNSRQAECKAKEPTDVDSDGRFRWGELSLDE